MLNEQIFMLKWFIRFKNSSEIYFFSMFCKTIYLKKVFQKISWHPNLRGNFPLLPWKVERIGNQGRSYEPRKNSTLRTPYSPCLVQKIMTVLRIKFRTPIVPYCAYSVLPVLRGALDRPLSPRPPGPSPEKPLAEIHRL